MYDDADGRVVWSSLWIDIITGSIGIQVIYMYVVTYTLPRDILVYF